MKRDCTAARAHGSTIGPGPRASTARYLGGDRFRFVDADLGDGATREYSFLSEFSHPNSFAFTNHIDWKEAGKPKMKIAFTRPDTEMLIQVIPSAVMSCMSVLLSGYEFLRRLSDNSLEKPLQEAEKVTRPE